MPKLDIGYSSRHNRQLSINTDFLRRDGCLLRVIGQVSEIILSYIILY